jgi:hypothetical protein
MEAREGEAAARDAAAADAGSQDTAAVADAQPLQVQQSEDEEPVHIRLYVANLAWQTTDGKRGTARASASSPPWPVGSL